MMEQQKQPRKKYRYQKDDVNVDSGPASLDVRDDGAPPSGIESGSGHQTAFKLGSKEVAICLSPMVNDGGHHQDCAVLSEQ